MDAQLGRSKYTILALSENIDKACSILNEQGRNLEVRRSNAFRKLVGKTIHFPQICHTNYRDIKNA